MVSLRRSIDDRANNYNYKYLNCYLETITRTVSGSLVLVDIATIFYDHLTTSVIAFIIVHIISCLLYFLSSFKPKKFLISQFIIFSFIFIMYSMYNFAVAITLLIAEGYNILLLRLSLSGCSIFLEIYAIYISVIYYIRLKNIEDYS